MAIQIRDVMVFEGPAYEVQSEDGPVATFSLLIGADAADGRQFVHISSFPRRRPERAERFADIVYVTGAIDPRYWEEVPHRTTEERFAHLAEVEALDRAGYDTSFWGDYL